MKRPEKLGMIGDGDKIEGTIDLHFTERIPGCVVGLDADLLAARIAISVGRPEPRPLCVCIERERCMCVDIAKERAPLRRKIRAAAELFKGRPLALIIFG